jgi:hypothetical protein
MAPKDRAQSVPSLPEANAPRGTNPFSGPVSRAISEEEEEEDEGPLSPKYEKEEASYSEGGSDEGGADVPPTSNNPVGTKTSQNRLSYPY